MIPAFSPERGISWPLAQDKPDATLKLSAGHGWNRLQLGGGTLTYQVGGASIEATGDVYGLKKLEDFKGNYTWATAVGTLGGGAAGTAMQNQAGVVDRAD